MIFEIHLSAAASACSPALTDLTRQLSPLGFEPVPERSFALPAMRALFRSRSTYLTIDETAQQLRSALSSTPCELLCELSLVESQQSFVVPATAVDRVASTDGSPRSGPQVWAAAPQPVPLAPTPPFVRPDDWRTSDLVQQAHSLRPDPQPRVIPIHPEFPMRSMTPADLPPIDAIQPLSDSAKRLRAIAAAKLADLRRRPTRPF